jgi:peptide/nickel transport system permease protein
MNMGLSNYIAKRVLVSIPLIVGVFIINFLLVHLAPGGPEAMYMDPRIPAEMRHQILEKLGLADPLHIQLYKYSVNILQGDLGISFFQGTSVTNLIVQRLPATLLLMGTGLFLSTLIGILLGVIAARRPGAIDRGISLFCLFGYSMPAFWVGLLLLMTFTQYIHIFPSYGITTIGAEFSVIDLLSHLVLPVANLTLYSLAGPTLFTRSSMLEVLQQDYITTARGKGLRARAVLFRHALRNSLLPVATNIGISLAYLLSGAVVVEVVFSWPGLGLLTYDAVLQRDYPVLLGLFLVFSLMVVFVNLIMDVVYGLLDPRITYG